MAPAPVEVVEVEPVTDDVQNSFEVEKPKKSRADSPAPKKEGKESKEQDLKDVAKILAAEALDKKATMQTQTPAAAAAAAAPAEAKTTSCRVHDKKKLAALIIVVCALLATGMFEDYRARGLAIMKLATVPFAVTTSLMGVAASLYVLRGKFGKLSIPFRTAKKDD
ncbi:unnamed protein product [Symbiodinium natans]|uniref:Transmembrane protein n=1 Tax=Symbiodinium natans TaxID=878477 RepID=A0A812Q741_9DINO|nr:unnamed protein product [Symbiodinium natans]CAE7370318.1 unnamed protein product [Symbiodinium natans]